MFKERLLTMDTAIIVVLISSLTSLFGTIVMWFLNRKAIKSDKNDMKLKEHDEKLSKMDGKLDAVNSSINVLGSKLNETLRLQDEAIQGLCWTIDGLEKANILNGHGKKYLEKINDIYKQKGLEAMKFESLSVSRRKKEK